MNAQRLLLHLLVKTAASPFSGLIRNIAPAFKADSAPMSAGISRGPGVQAVKPSLLEQVQRPIGPGGNPLPPRVASSPALEAKSVFKAPPNQNLVPTARIRNPAAPHELYAQPASPAISTDIEDMKAKEEELATRMRDPQLDPSSRVVMQNQLKKIYEQLQTGPALGLSNAAGHDAALAARAAKIQSQRAALLSSLYREAEQPVPTMGNAPTERVTANPFY